MAGEPLLGGILKVYNPQSHGLGCFSRCTFPNASRKSCNENGHTVVCMDVEQHSLSLS